MPRLATRDPLHHPVLDLVERAHNVVVVVEVEAGRVCAKAIIERIGAREAGRAIEVDRERNLVLLLGRHECR